MASHDYTAVLEWRLEPDADFTALRYSRAHRWQFDGGLSIPASSSPLSVPLPWSDTAAVDPEEAFVASVASCHMLWFLSQAARRGLTVTAYRDQAVGVLERNANGRLAITRVTLRPSVAFAGDAPDADAVAKLHHEAHSLCYIANSIRSEVIIEPQPV